MRSRDRGADRFAWSGSAETFAEGIATRTTFDLTFTMLKSSLDDVVTLEESELEEGLSAALAAPTTWPRAPAPRHSPPHARPTFRPAPSVVCVMTGGNADERTLRRALA